MKDFLSSLYRLYKFPIFLTVFSFVIFFQSSSFSFTYFDDDAILIRNRNFLENQTSTLHVLTLDAEFQNKSIELYRPTQNLSFYLETRLFDFNPSVFHSFNWGLHLCVVLLIYLLLLEFKINPFFAFLLSSIFNAHPIIAFTVSWLPARGDLLLAFFTLISVVSYVRFINYKRSIYLVFHFLGFIFALFSKESALMILPLIGLLHVFYKRKIQFSYQYVILGIGYFITLILYFLMRAEAVAAPPSDHFSLSNGFENIGTIPETIFYLFLPFNIPVLPFYSLIKTSMGLVFIVAISIYFFKNGLKINQSFGLIWFILFLGPGMLYSPQWSSYIYDYLLHRTYLPMIGLLIFSGVSFNSYFVNSSKNNVSKILLGLLLLLSILSFSFSRNFKNPISFWQYAVETNPKSAFANAYLGNAYMLENKLSKALASYTQALKLKPDFEDAIRNRAKTQLLLKNYEAALVDLDLLHKEYPNDSVVRLQITDAFFGLKQYEKIINFYNGISMDSIPWNALYKLGMSNIMLKNYESAFANLGYLMQKQPNDISVMRVFAVSCSMTSRDDEALDVNERIYLKDSNDFTSIVNLGYALWQIADYPQSLALFQKAYTRNSQNVDAILGLMLTYYKMGEFNRVLQLSQKLNVEMPSWTSSSNKIDLLLENGYLFTPKQAEVIMRF